MNTEIEVMDKTIKCLALELHEVVWKDVAEKWNAVKLAAASTVSEAGEDAIGQEEILKEVFDLLYAKYSFDKIETLQSKLKQSLCTKK